MTSVAPSGAGGVKFTAESRHHTRKGAAAFSAGWRYGGGRKRAASFWRARQDWTIAWQSAFIPRQKYYYFIA